MRNGTQRSMALQALMSPGGARFSGLNTFAFIQSASRPYFIKVKRLPSCASNNHAGRQKPLILCKMKNCVFLRPIWTDTVVCTRRKRRGGEESGWVSSALIPVSQLVFCWPEPRLLQPDDWFLFGAMPMGLIKSKCKLTLITNCRENASSQLPLRGGPWFLWQVKNPMSFPELPSPARTAWIFFPWITEKLTISSLPLSCLL